MKCVQDVAFRTLEACFLVQELGLCSFEVRPLEIFTIWGGKLSWGQRMMWRLLWPQPTLVGFSVKWCRHRKSFHDHVRFQNMSTKFNTSAALCWVVRRPRLARKFRTANFHPGRTAEGSIGQHGAELQLELDICRRLKLILLDFAFMAMYKPCSLSSDTPFRFRRKELDFWLDFLHLSTRKYCF